MVFQSSGEFWICVSDFVDTFARYYVCNLGPRSSIQEIANPGSLKLFVSCTSHIQNNLHVELYLGPTKKWSEFLSTSSWENETFYLDETLKIICPYRKNPWYRIKIIKSETTPSDKPQTAIIGLMQIKPLLDEGKDKKFRYCSLSIYDLKQLVKTELEKRAEEMLEYQREEQKKDEKNLEERKQINQAGVLEDQKIEITNEEIEKKLNEWIDSKQLKQNISSYVFMVIKPIETKRRLTREIILRVRLIEGHYLIMPQAEDVWGEYMLRIFYESEHINVSNNEPQDQAVEEERPCLGNVSLVNMLI